VVEEESFWAALWVKTQANAKKVVWWWPLPVPGGGNGDGWTNRYTLAHRNADAVCVKPQTRREREREREHGGVFNPAVVEVVECTISSLRESADRCNTRHRRGADPAQGAATVIASRA
jgi:hypothetical protein